MPHMSAGDVLRAMRADRRANARNPKSILMLTGYRIAHYFAVRKSSNTVLWVIGLPAMICYRLCVEWLLGVELPAKVRAGEGLVLWHGQGLVVNPAVVLGAGVSLRQNTTIGPKMVDGANTASPVLEDGVDVGANAVIVGPITIGAGATVGAGAVVTRDVAPGSTVAGNPARPIGDPGDPVATP
jgi:serine acetyltransferase